MDKYDKGTLLPAERIAQAIILIRGRRVMLDADLAALYGVETKQLVRAVKRNIDRFPEDFMFQISDSEFRSLRFHFGTSSNWGGRRYLPYAFTEQGVAMLSSVLKSKRAVQVNIAIMRVFVKLRSLLLTHKKLALKLTELERKTERHDGEIRSIFEAIRQLVLSPAPPRRRIGFHSET